MGNMGTAKVVAARDIGQRANRLESDAVGILDHRGINRAGFDAVERGFIGVETNNLDFVQLPTITERFKIDGVL